MPHDDARDLSGLADPQDPHEPHGSDRPPNPFSPRDRGGPDDPYRPHDPHRTLAALEQAGFPVGDMGDDQRAVLAGLSPAETEVLLDIKRRLDDSEPEVRAHEAGLIGGLFF